MKAKEARKLVAINNEIKDALLRIKIVAQNGGTICAWEYYSFKQPYSVIDELKKLGYKVQLFKGSIIAHW
jgi:hypothetical protein